MGFNEALFARLSRLFTRLRSGPNPELAARAVSLESVEKRLAVLARVLCGKPLEVRAAQDHGGLHGEILFLPQVLDAGTSHAANRAAYVLRTALLVAALESCDLLPIVRARDERVLATLLRAREIVQQAASRWSGFAELHARVYAEHEPRPLAKASFADRALGALERVTLGVSLDSATADLPASARQFVERASRSALGALAELSSVWRALPGAGRGCSFVPTYFPDLLPPPVRGASSAPLGSSGAEPPSRDALPSGTERQAPPRREVEVVELEEKEDQSPLIHVFEKVKTAEEHQGGKRELDGSDELALHLEALEELDLKQVLRSRAPTASIYRADLALDGAASELLDEDSRGEAVLYDEWNEARRAYRSGWCSVYVGAVEPADPNSTSQAVRSVRSRHARTIRALRGEFERIEKSRALRRRQIIGTDFDLDAVVDRHAALLAARRHGGRVEDQRLYVARRPSQRDLATFVLLDASLSTDSWIENRRVLDIARESIVVLAEVLQDVRLRVGVAAFFSNARRDCRFQIVKDFDEGWVLGYRRLYGIRPTGYTRIGPALRHAASLLDATGSRRKLLVLISDGKPTDYDRYEGRYGIADVRQALRESRSRGVRTVALTIDARAQGHLPHLFGEGSFSIVRHPRDLPVALARLQERVLR